MAPFRSVTTTAAHGTKRKIRPIVAHSFLCCGRPAPQTKTNNMAPRWPKRARGRLKTVEDEDDEEGGEGADGANSVLRRRFGPRLEARLSFFAYMTPVPGSSSPPRGRPRVQNRPLRLEEIRAKQQQWVNMITGESYWVTPDPMAEVEVLRLAKLLCIPQRAMVFEKDQPSDGAPRFFCLSYPSQMPYIGRVNEGGLIINCFCAVCDDMCLPRGRTPNSGPLRECPQCGLDDVCPACLVGAPLDDKCILCLSETFDPLYLPGMYKGAVTRLQHVNAMTDHLFQIHPESKQAHRMINGKVYYGDFSWNNVANLSSLFPFRLAFDRSFWRR